MLAPASVDILVYSFLFKDKFRMRQFIDEKMGKESMYSIWMDSQSLSP